MNHRAKKSFGQNFLTSNKVAHDIVSAGNIKKGDVVLEVGPGKGRLTKELLKKGALVYAVEKDTDLISHLEELFAEEIKEKQLILFNKDILTLKEEELPKKYKVIANIPYNITGKLISHFLTLKTQPKHMVLMVQKEVADRILAKDKKESILSLSVKVFSDPLYVRKVKASLFSPAPKVDSAVVAFTNISRKHFGTIKEEDFFTIIKKGFAQKRKLLKNNLNVSQKILSSCTIADDARAEEVTLTEWLCLTKKLCKK